MIVRSLYDEDLDDHVMIVQDWVHKTGVDQFIPHHWDDGSNKEIFIKIYFFSKKCIKLRLSGRRLYQYNEDDFFQKF